MKEIKKILGTIVCIDDVVENLQVLGRHLQNKGYRVAVAKDGESGIAVIKKIKPDLILLDVMMPILDGYETCKRLKSDPEVSHIPIIFLTAKNDTEDILEGFRLGAVDFITKPFNKEELYVRVNTHVILKVALETIERQNRTLKSLNVVKDKIFSIIAHDLRSPLANIKMFIDVATSSVISMKRERIVQHLKSLGESSNEVLALLDNLLNWGRAQTGRVPFKPVEIEVEELCSSIVSLYSMSAKHKGVELRASSNLEVPNIWADRDMTYTTLRNLVSNALKFTPSGGTVKIEVKEDREFIAISVQDTGVGIGKDDISKLFNDAVHFTNHGTNNEKGTGLGISLCSSFVEKNGGKLTVDSTINEGSRFTFTTPQLKYVKIGKIKIEAT